ncbi:MAG TPA: Holliday junction resolvase-like protein [Gemmatimonadaceae bacterium]
MENSVLALGVGIGIGAIIALLCVAVILPRYNRRVRSEAIQQSRSVTRGQIFEQLVPYLPEFRFNPKDAQFLGRPVDFVVFDGLDEGEVRRIVFVEVKTGASTLTTRERRVRDAIRRGHVEWAEIRVGDAPMKPGTTRPALR